MVRPMDNSQQPSSGRADSSRVAPYLTHLVTHHGQLTLIPPQNTGRIRKTKGKTQRAERRRDNDEPRFNTAAPVSSRRTQTTAGRLHRPIQPSRVSRGKYICYTVCPEGGANVCENPSTNIIARVGPSYRIDRCPQTQSWATYPSCICGSDAPFSRFRST